MWRTSCGDRVLNGKERSLFAQGAACLMDLLMEEAKDTDPDPDTAWPTGVDQFDRLDAKARVILLRDVVQALVDPSVPTPTLTAANEAAVHAVFRFLRCEIEMEIDCEGYGPSQEPELDDSFLLGCDPLYWRKLVLAAYLEGRGPVDASGGGGEESLEPSCTDLEEWDLQLECLADQILWDRDWELEEIMDLPPQRARTLKRLLRIDQDYFLATPAEPLDAQVREAVAYLRRLADEDRGDREYAVVTLQYAHDGLVGLEFADPELNGQHGCPGRSDQDVIQDAQVTIPLLIAMDAARVLRKIAAAEREEEKFLEVIRTQERLSHLLHPYLPEDLQRRFWQTFEIAPGISAERDYGTTSVEFNLEKFARVKFDKDTREEVEVATEGLRDFLHHLVSNPNYDFSDSAVRHALIATAQQMASELADTGEVDQGEEDV